MSKLVKIQSELKAAKNQRNNFGKYNYRSCEDILESVKPLLKDAGLHLIVTDKIVMVGERYYVEATATLFGDSEPITSTAFAREAENKKGMDSAQVTGATSSYARKYALNGLFAIDDSKDVDTDEHHKQTDGNKPATKPKAKLDARQFETICDAIKGGNAKYTKESIKKGYDLSKEQVKKLDDVKIAPKKEEPKVEVPKVEELKVEAPKKEVAPVAETKAPVKAAKLKCLQTKLDEICEAIFRGTTKTTKQAVLDFYNLTPEQIKQVNAL
jgi:hypothetical protein